MIHAPSEFNCWGTHDEQLLLKAGLLTGERAISAWQEWCQLKGADFDHINYVSYTLLPLVSKNLAKNNYHDEWLIRCKSIYRRTWAFNQSLWRKVLLVLHSFKKAGIDKIVLLKGMAMIAHYYKDFGVRVIGDVDVLIPKHEVEKAVPILIEAGWTTNISRFDPKILPWHAAMFKLDAGTNLDLHWSLIFESFSNIDEKILGDAESIPLDNLILYIPNSTDLLIQACVHGMQNSPVPLIRWICDAMTILNQSRQQIDWNRLIAFAKQLHVCAILKMAFIFLNTQFDADIPQEVIEQLKEMPISRLERWENWFKKHNFYIGKSWARFCLQNGYTTWMQQILYTPNYFQHAARLKHKWQILPFSLYWMMKRFYRLCLRVHS